MAPVEALPFPHHPGVFAMSRRMIRTVTMVAAFATLTVPAAAQHEGHDMGAMNDSAAVAAVVSKYHMALSTG
jgi:hypothetical protein